MLLRFVRNAGLLAAAAAVCSCGAGSTEVYEPLLGATPIPVSLQTTSSTVRDLPQLQVTGLAGQVEVVWDVESAPCLITDASGAQAGSVIEIQIHRSGNPLASCVAGSVAYHYVVRALALPAGRYEVRLIDAMFGLPAHEVGRRSILVSPAG